MNILFVCTGNISRSYLAEMLFKNEVRLNRMEDFFVSSAGTHACPGTPADPHMGDYLSEIGVPAEGHNARIISKKDVEWADLILVMEKIHSEVIKDRWPEAEQKTELLGRYISPDQSEEEIVDPFGMPLYQYSLVRSEITLAVRSLVKKFLLERYSDQAQVHSC
jgi:protein-tyrosine-phosphatase